MPCFGCVLSSNPGIARRCKPTGQALQDVWWAAVMEHGVAKEAFEKIEAKLPHHPTEKQWASLEAAAKEMDRLWVTRTEAHKALVRHANDGWLPPQEEQTESPASAETL